MPAAVAAALADTGTLIWKGMFGFSKTAALTNIIATTLGLLYLHSSNGNFTSYDGTTTATNNAIYTANTLTKAAVQWPSSAGKFKVGVDINSGGIAYGAEANFDGAFPAVGTLSLGSSLNGPLYFSKVAIYNKLITDAQVNAF